LAGKVTAKNIKYLITVAWHREVGITADELKVCQQEGSDEIVKKLKEQGIFPYTDLRRKTMK